jgi:hypothetical protein
VEVIVFEPGYGVADNRTNRSTPVPRMTAGRAALVSLMNRYLAALLDPTVTLLEVHKLMYFLQEAGEPLRLRYVKAPYGPYAENLRHVLRTIEDHLIEGYTNAGDAPDKPLQLVPGAVRDAETFLASQPATLQRSERVVHLVEGYETPFGLELLATLHWVVVKEGAREMKAIVEGVRSWNQRKRQFTPAQIELAAQRLREQGWIER